jgi:hypothetical protein
MRSSLYNGIGKREGQKTHTFGHDGYYKPQNVESLAKN